MSLALYQTWIIYVHFTFYELSRVCIHLGMHNHHVSNDTCHASLDMAYQCVANEVMNTSTAKIYIIMKIIYMCYGDGKEQYFLAYYLLKLLSTCKGNHLVGSSLDLLMDKFNSLASPNYQNLVSRSKIFVYSGWGR